MTKKKTPKKRLFIDWDSIEPLYRAGTLSLHKICEQYKADHVNSQVWKNTVTHAAILKHAKSKKWTRNLAGKVQRRIKEKLVTGSVTNSNLSEEEMVDKVSEAGVGVIVRHREEIIALLEHENILLNELKTATRKVLVTTGDTSELKDVKLELKDRSIILKNITDVRKQRIALERQAHNIIDDGDGMPPDADNLSEMEVVRRLAFLLRKGTESNG